MTAKQRFRWLSILSILILVAAACSSGSDTEVGQSDSDDSSSDDSSSDDSSSDDSSSDDSSSDDSASDDSSSDDSGSDDADPAQVRGEVNCDEISDAVSSAGGLVGGDPAFFTAGDQERQFEEARAIMLALKEQAPEIADDIDKTLAGLEAIGEAFAEIGWDTDFSADPAAAGQLARTAFSDPAVSAMMTSVANIGIWLASNCLS